METGLEESPLKSTEVPFGEKELQKYLARLKVHESLTETLGSSIFSAFSTASIEPKDWLERFLQWSFPQEVMVKSAVIEKNEGEKKLVFVEIPPSEKSARLIYVLNKGERKKSKWPIENFLIIDRENGRTIDLLDVIAEDFKVMYNTKGQPHVDLETKTLYLGPIRRESHLSPKLVGHDVEISLHEILHTVKRQEESFLEGKMTKNKKALFLYLLAASFHILGYLFSKSKDYREFTKGIADMERKDWALVIRFIRKMRQLGVDPLPNVTNQELLSSCKRFLFENDAAFFPGETIFSH